MTPRKSFEMTVRMENRLWWRNFLVTPFAILVRAPLIYSLFKVADIANWLGLWLEEHLPGYRF